MRVIVVGGGITGLAATRYLRDQGLAVTLINRTFPFGGRLRPDVVEIPDYGRACFDPGPVVLSPNASPANTMAPIGLPPLPLLPSLFPPDCADEVLRVQIPHVTGEALPGDPPELLTTPRGGARTIVNRLCPTGLDEHCDLLTPTTVMALEPDGRGWRVRTETADGYRHVVRGDAVLLTQPVPEAVALLDDCKVEIPEAIRDELRTVRYSSMLAVQAAFRGTSDLPRGGVVTFSDSPLTLVSDNRVLGVSPVGPALTALFDPDRVELREGESDEELASRLLPLLAGWVSGQPVWQQIRRWARFRPSCRLRMPFAEALGVPPLVLAGDGFASYVQNQLDAASTSAHHAASHLCRTLAREARLVQRPIHRTPTPVSLEVSVSSVDEVQIAVANGADRLLLCVAPEVGGLTPTVDAIRLTKDAFAGCALPITVLIRPRLGGFEYSPGEFEQMRRDARRLLRAGADGIAFGLLSVSGGEARVDAERCRPLVDLAHALGREAVFNRAFDCLPDPRTGLQDLIALGFDRVYTSGRRRLAIDGTSELTAAVAYAGWEIEVVAAGGITHETVGYVTHETGCRQVLVGLRACVEEPSDGMVPSFARQAHSRLDARAVASMNTALRSKSLAVG